MLDIGALSDVEFADSDRFTDLVSVSGLDPKRDFVGLYLGPISVFQNESISGFNFEGAILDGARFRNVDLTNVNFKEASLVGADLRGAKYYADQFSQQQLDSMLEGNPEGISIRERPAPVRSTDFRKPITKREFVSAISNTAGFDKTTASLALDALSSVILREVSAGGAVTLPGIGKIYARDRPERMVRNPTTGEQIKKQADRSVQMTIAKALKDASNS